jgi:hypothetical protein
MIRKVVVVLSLITQRTMVGVIRQRLGTMMLMAVTAQVTAGTAA